MEVPRDLWPLNVFRMLFRLGRSLDATDSSIRSRGSLFCIEGANLRYTSRGRLATVILG